MRDRAILILSVLIGILAFTAAGLLQPRLTEMASEQYLALGVAGESRPEAQRRVSLSRIRSIETKKSVLSGQDLSFKYLGDIRTWTGKVGDDVAVGFETAKGQESIEAVVRGQGGFGLRYTDEAEDGAPPMVVLGTALGALRGLLVDYLWIKVTLQKEKGLLYEVMSDANLITALQPRFPEVWSFHGHNMAYNISVMTNTPEERWAWVNAGISLVRDKGVRYNPNSLLLCKELAFWFSHKIDGVADDAHLTYKRQFAREWQYLLGIPPQDYEQRKAWIKAIADAPDTLDGLYAKVPEAKDFVSELETKLAPLPPRYAFAADKRFLLLVGEWASRQSSPYARFLGLRAMSEEAATLVGIFDSTFGDPARARAGGALMAFLRKRVLVDAYNMDPALMSKYTAATGPLDWRHPAAHALYWARRGSEYGEHRITDDKDIYKVINNYRVDIQAMQALARSGLVQYDPFSGDNVTRLNDARWIKVIDEYFEVLYKKHYDVRGAGGDTFTNFHENFMKQAVRELYRTGDVAGGQAILDKLDRLYGRGSFNENTTYHVPIDEFVRSVTYGEFEMQPEVARSDVYSVLERGFREGLLLDNEQVLKEALEYARGLTRYFREARYNDFVNKFGEGRMKDLIGELDQSIPAVFTKILLDTSQPLLDRLIIFRKAPDEVRALVYDQVRPALELEFKSSRLASSGLVFANLVPEPAGIDAFRKAQAEAAKAKAEAVKQENRSDAERK